MRTAMMAITTSSSISVKALRGRERGTVNFSGPEFVPNYSPQRTQRNAEAIEAKPLSHYGLHEALLLFFLCDPLRPLRGVLRIRETKQYVRAGVRGRGRRAARSRPCGRRRCGRR